jgi:hypothetical protein
MIETMKGVKFLRGQFVPTLELAKVAVLRQISKNGNN